jgi:uncharacterized membrane protein YhaH (DUF805 family)
LRPSCRGCSLRGFLPLLITAPQFCKFPKNGGRTFAVPRPESPSARTWCGYSGRMNFSQAISSGFENYSNFRGRAVRSEFWYWTLFSILAVWASALVDSSAGTLIVELLVNLALFLPGLAVTVRRLHDINRGGWWFWIGLIPIVGWMVIFFFLTTPSDPEPNRFG